MDTGVVVAIVVSGLALVGVVVKSVADSRAARHATQLESRKHLTNGYHNLTGDAMARIAQLQEHVAKLETENEQMRARIRALEEQMAQMRVDFAQERTDWQRETRALRRNNEQYRKRLEAALAVRVDASNVTEGGE